MKILAAAGISRRRHGAGPSRRRGEWPYGNLALIVFPAAFPLL
jgi:hypothetical protein